MKANIDSGRSFEITKAESFQKEEWNKLVDLSEIIHYLHATIDMREMLRNAAQQSHTT